MIARINGFLVCLLVSFTIWGYQALPARIPIHFDLAGNPNRYGSRSSFILLAMVGITTIAFLYVVTRIALRNPSLINMPDKKRFLTLPPQEQRRVLEPFTELSDYMITMLCILFIVIELSIFRSAAGRSVSTLLQGTLITAVIAMLVLPLIMLAKVQKRLNEALRRVGSAGDIR